jgi:hypothetical protein
LLLLAGLIDPSADYLETLEKTGRATNHTGMMNEFLVDQQNIARETLRLHPSKLIISYMDEIIFKSQVHVLTSSCRSPHPNYPHPNKSTGKSV